MTGETSSPAVSGVSAYPKLHSTLHGAEYHKVSPKNQVTIPRHMMQALRAGKEGPLFLVRFLDDGFLRLVTQEQLDRMLDRIRDHPKLDAPQKAAAIRHLSSGAKLVEPDQQGRFVLPSQLVQEMGLREEVAFCGAQNRIEIWPAAARRDLESADQQVLRKLEPAIKEVLDL